jgi:hypothetical protein
MISSKERFSTGSSTKILSTLNNNNNNNHNIKKGTLYTWGVGITTAWTVWVGILEVQEFSPHHSVQTSSRATLSLGVKRQGCEADHSSPSSADVRNGGAIPPTPLSSWHSAKPTQHVLQALLDHVRTSITSAENMNSLTSCAELTEYVDTRDVYFKYTAIQEFVLLLGLHEHQAYFVIHVDLNPMLSCHALT